MEAKFPYQANITFKGLAMQSYAIRETIVSLRENVLELCISLLCRYFLGLCTDELSSLTWTQKFSNRTQHTMYSSSKYYIQFEQILFKNSRFVEPDKCFPNHYNLDRFKSRVNFLFSFCLSRFPKKGNKATKMSY